MGLETRLRVCFAFWPSGGVHMSRGRIFTPPPGSWADFLIACPIGQMAAAPATAIVVFRCSAEFVLVQRPASPAAPFGTPLAPIRAFREPSAFTRNALIVPFP